MTRVRPSGAFNDDYLAFLLVRAAQHVSRKIDAELRKRGIRTGVWRVLSILDDGAGFPIGELAELACLKQPAMSKLVDRLTAAGLVERRPSTRDQRKVLVFITDRGRERLGDSLVRAKEHERKILDKLIDEDVERLKATLRALIDRGPSVGASIPL